MDLSKNKVWLTAQRFRHNFLVNALCVVTQNQKGFAGMAILMTVLGIVITIIVLANAIPILWPMATVASGNITAMTGTDSGTVMIKAFWPVALLVIGIGVAIAVIVYALKEFGILS